MDKKLKDNMENEIHKQIMDLKSNLNDKSNWHVNAEYKKMSFVKVGEVNGNG